MLQTFTFHTLSFGPVLCFTITPMYIRLLCFCKLVYAIKFCHLNESLQSCVGGDGTVARQIDELECALLESHKLL